jgi:hypothetical protein
VNNQEEGASTLNNYYAGSIVSAQMDANSMPSIFFVKKKIFFFEKKFNA